MSDALVKLDVKHMKGTAAKFTDNGYMRVDLNTLMAGGNSLGLPSGLDGAFIHYQGTGTQDFASGKISYSTLNYTLVGYTGNPSFPISTGQDPKITGSYQGVVIAHGSLDTTHAEVLQYGKETGIHGELDVSVLAGLTGTQKLGTMAIQVDHGPEDVKYLSSAPSALGPLPSALTLQDGSLYATFTPTGHN